MEENSNFMYLAFGDGRRMRAARRANDIVAKGCFVVILCCQEVCEDCKLCRRNAT